MVPVHALILAAGKSSRMKGIDKLFLPLGSITVLRKSVQAFLSHPAVTDVTVVVSKETREKAKDALRGLPVVFVTGGKERVDSVKNGVAVLQGGIVAIHDAARPFVTEEIITDALAGVQHGVGTAPAVPVKDTIKVAKDGFVSSTPERVSLRAVQTPQCFLLDEYRAALENAPSDVTDDAGVFEHAGFQVKLTAGDERNKKITTPADIKEDFPMLRIGHGYDVHKLVEGRRLILCGVGIPYEKGLLGHSDADAATHAVMDALLGAAGLPDIGHLFPDNDPAYEGADSLKLLETVVSRLAENGWKIANVDVTVLCQRPKLAPYINEMKETLSRTVGSPVNVKATTEEGLGFTGSGDGIAVHAVCLLEKA